MDDWREELRRLYEELNENKQDDGDTPATDLDVMLAFIREIAFPALMELQEELATHGRTATLYDGQQFARISVKCEQRTEIHFEILARARTKGVYWYTRVSPDDTGGKWQVSDKINMGLLDRPVSKTTKGDVIEAFLRAYKVAVT